MSWLCLLRFSSLFVRSMPKKKQTENKMSCNNKTWLTVCYFSASVFYSRSACPLLQVWHSANEFEFASRLVFWRERGSEGREVSGLFTVSVVALGRAVRALEGMWLCGWNQCARTSCVPHINLVCVCVCRTHLFVQVWVNFFFFPTSTRWKYLQDDCDIQLVTFFWARTTTELFSCPFRNVSFRVCVCVLL